MHIIKQMYINLLYFASNHDRMHDRIMIENQGCKEGGIYMAQISLRVDDDVKRNAERTFDAIGLSMSTAVNIFFKNGCKGKPYSI